MVIAREWGEGEMGSYSLRGTDTRLFGPEGQQAVV